MAALTHSAQRLSQTVHRYIGAADALPEPLFHRWDGMIRAVLWMHVPVLGLLMFAVGSGVAPHEIAEVGGVALIATLASVVQNHTVRACLTSFGLMSCSALLVHTTGGVTEAHFHFFIVLGLIALYQDWRPYALAAAYVLLHHGVVGVLNPHAVYDSARAIAHPVLWASIHGGALAAASAVQPVFWRGSE